MNHALCERERHLIPRWRSLCLSHSTMELAIPHASDANAGEFVPSRDFERKLLQWQCTPTVVSAAELVAASIVEAQEEVATQAARFVLSHKSAARPLVRELALRVLGRRTAPSRNPRAEETSAAKRKRQWRHRTRVHPNNALAWVELALCELIAGRDKAAQRTMVIALQLARDNRHVLRSASRLFIHLGDWERAYNIVVRSASITVDPWLIAAELSIAKFAHKAPKYVKQGRRIIENNSQGPRQITELAGALGTLELEAGRRKKARDLFTLSAIEPTGNALAQLEWLAYNKHLHIDSGYTLDNWNEIGEAMAYRFGREEKLSKVARVCHSWIKTEPFTSRPYEIASSASTIAGRMDEALKFTVDGLRLHPRNVVLLNNHAFALAHLGRLSEAHGTLKQLGNQDSKSVLVAEANKGLIAMRMGDHETGRFHYKEAIEKFRGQKLWKFADVAQIYFAREAAIAGVADAEKQVGMARKAMYHLKTTIHEHVLREAELQLGRRAGGRRPA